MASILEATDCTDWKEPLSRKHVVWKKCRVFVSLGVSRMQPEPAANLVFYQPPTFSRPQAFADRCLRSALSVIDNLH